MHQRSVEAFAAILGSTGAGDGRLSRSGLELHTHGQTERQATHAFLTFGQIRKWNLKSWKLVSGTEEAASLM